MSDPIAPTDDSRNLGRRLRQARADKGMSLQDVEAATADAPELGRFKASVLGAYERGERAISVKRLGALAEFYGVPVTAFTGATGDDQLARIFARQAFDAQQLADNLKAAGRHVPGFVEALAELTDDHNRQMLLEVLATVDTNTVDEIADANRDASTLSEFPQSLAS